jgi:hypothetical protein
MALGDLEQLVLLAILQLGGGDAIGILMFPIVSSCSRNFGVSIRTCGS